MRDTEGEVLANYPVDTGRKLNAHKTFRRRPGRRLNVLCTFNLRPVPVRYTYMLSYYEYSKAIAKRKMKKKVCMD